MTSDLRRTQLAVPASDPTMIANAAESGADEVFLDLEDSVAPNAKVEAREPLIEAARDHDWSGTILSFRMNGVDTSWWYDDIIEVVGRAGEHIDDIVVPMVAGPSDVHTVENLLTQVEENNGLESGGIGLEPQIEDGDGIHNVYDIAHASDRLSSIIFGPGDYAAAMGTPGLDIGQFPDYPGHYWHHALSECNAAAKSAGLPCIDGPYADVEDTDGYRESCERASMLGCDGKWAIHPSQIEIGNDVFAPDPEVAERAERIVEAYAEAMEEGKGAVSVDGQLVDEATNKMAQDIVATARAADML
ncbi:HpcH/HpaI aldolase/citrate lyase family protein [Haloplanus sp.]|uniref:HpcH/HpaI aldolase/citrate lyase family protein n=1 Tax=Haloplanus sp. TaxID=1961696 RepID=UPI0026127248|nr:CoA ester lyase [Haloplanus sp.]